MDVIIGIDIGNATTEGVAATFTDSGIKYLESDLVPTTGTKGTIENIEGIQRIVNSFCNSISDINIKKILINNATPVIADFAMDTITETVITDSTMIGHNPDTPGGEGTGIGYTFNIQDGSDLSKDDPYIAVIDDSSRFDEASSVINSLLESGHDIQGAIVQKDEGTLVNNRLTKTIPIVDEVKGIDKIKSNLLCAVEVAPLGYSIDLLSNPYGIASAFGLNAEETEYCRMISKALIGNRSAVVIRTPKGDISERVIPAGKLEVKGQNYSITVAVDSGAEKIMKEISRIGEMVDIKGESGTNIGGMIENIKVSMAKNINLHKDDIHISDLMAVDTTTSVSVKGGLAGEYAMENSVAVASMIRSNNTAMKNIADELEEKLGVCVKVEGVEGEMALKGALTTPGSGQPVIMVDIGAGSTDAAYIDEQSNVRSIHLAGAGNLVTMLINSELNLDDFDLAESIKINPIAKVESLFKIRYENGDIKFFDQPLSPEYYGRIITIAKDGAMEVVNTNLSLEKISQVRKSAKEKVLVKNVLRTLEYLDLNHNLCNHIVLIGGSFLDFEAANMVTEALSDKRMVAGKGNIRGVEGPRSAVATGLVMNYYEELAGVQDHGE